ncbi:MAG: pyridoxamine 5'-phosphate oxidase family protein [Anaerolineae bacterium]
MGWCLARSVFHHSMNYRSVVLFGNGTLVMENKAKMRALEVLTNHVVDGAG